MNVLFLSPSGQLGGAETSLLNLLSGLRERCSDFRPAVVAPEEGLFTAHCRRLSIPHYILPMPPNLERMGDSQVAGSQQVWLKFLALARRAPDFVRYAQALRNLLRRERPEIIHTNGFKMHMLGAWVNGCVPLKSRAAVIGHIHDYVSPRPLSGRLLKSSSHLFTTLIANSESVARDIRDFLRFQRVTTIYNAIDTERFSPRGPVLDLDRLSGLPAAPAGTVRVGLVATFAKWKGHMSFLRALAETRGNVRGYIIGGPVYKTAHSQTTLGELEAEAARLGLAGKVGFTGFVEDIPAAIRTLDVVVHASTSPEPFGMAIIEAMACGRAVVVSNMGGASELFTEGVTGLGHAPGDEHSLARTIGRLASDSSLRRALAENARRHVCSQFQISEMARRVHRIYQNATHLKMEHTPVRCG